MRSVEWGWRVLGISVRVVGCVNRGGLLEDIRTGTRLVRMEAGGRVASGRAKTSGKASCAWTPAQWGGTGTHGVSPARVVGRDRWRTRPPHIDRFRRLRLFHLVTRIPRHSMATNRHRRRALRSCLSCPDRSLEEAEAGEAKGRRERIGLFRRSRRVGR